MPLRIGDEAPNFDLTSTAGVLLMLRDEVPRTAVVLYVTREAGGERARRDLAALARAEPALVRRRARVLALSPAPLAQLTALAAELALPFPLLHDDRSFTAAYDVHAREDGLPPSPALYLIHRDQHIRWMANPVAAVDQALREVETVLATKASSAVNYPRAVLNRWIERLVH